jgi:hypothetical protein
MQRQNHFLNQLILHSLLLQADAVAKAVVAKVVVERLFGKRPPEAALTG